MRHFSNNKAIVVLIGITCIFFYAMFWSGNHYSIDGVVMFEYAKALLFQKSFSMDPPVIWGKDVITISKWAIGQTIIYIPLLWTFSKTIFSNDPSYTQIPYNPELPRNPDLLENRPYLSVSYTNALVTSVSVIILYLFLLDLGVTRKKAIIVALLFGFFSPAAVYAKLDYAQPLASLCLLLSFYFLYRGWKQNSKLYYFLSGLALGGTVLTRTEMLVFQVPIMAVTTLLLQRNYVKGLKIEKEGIINFAIFCIPILFVVVINQYINYLRFGTILATGYNIRTMFRPEILPLLGNLISPGRGLLIFFPLALLCFFSISKLRNNMILCAMFFSAFGSIFFYSFFNDGWAAGVSWGPRLLIPYIPYFAALSYFGYETLKAKKYQLAKLLFLVFAFVGAIFSFQGLLFNWLRFYGSLRLTNQDTLDGFHHFTLDHSPIFSGWDQLLLPAEYDIYWFQHPTGLHRLSMVISLGIAFLLGALFITWIYILKNPTIDSENSTDVSA